MPRSAIRSSVASCAPRPTNVADSPPPCIERAVARGDLPADVDVDLLVTLLSGPLVYTKLVRRQRVTDELVAEVVDNVLAGHRIPSAAPGSQ